MYGAMNIPSYTRHMMQNCVAFRDSPIIPLGRSPGDVCVGCVLPEKCVADDILDLNNPC